MNHRTFPPARIALLARSIPASLLLLLLLLALQVSAQARYEYTNNVDGTISITAYNGPDGNVSIPGSIDGLTVTAIGENAFRDANVTSVTFPDSVVSIGAFAFAYTPFTSVTIPDNVTDIGAGAFLGGWKLTQATIGKNVIRIGDGAFAYCAKLTDLSVSPLNPTYVVIDGVLFNHDQTQLIQYPGGKTDSAYTIPGSVTIVGAGAFAGGFLTSIAIPDDVTNLADAAFEDSSYGLTRFYGLSDLYALTNITVARLNAAYASINGVLFDRAQTRLIQYPAARAESSYTIPDSVIIVSAASFQSSGNLTNITIGSQVASIQTAAFSGCVRLAGVTIPDNVTDLGDEVFSNCLRLTNVIIGSGVSRIGHYAFVGCNHLKSLTIGEGVGSIGEGAFLACSLLPSVTIPNSVTNIESQAFWNIGLTNVTFGTGLTTITPGAFSGCYGLTSAYFKGNAPTIAPSPFPEFVTNVFDFDDKLTIYYLPGTTGWGSTFADRPAVLLDPQGTAVQISYNFESGSFQNGIYEDLATYNPIGNARFVITNGTLTISEPASPVPNITPAVAAILSSTTFTNLEESIDFTGWNNSAEARPVIYLTARETAKGGGAYDFYSLNVTPAPFPEAIPPYSTAAGLSITRWSNNVPLVPAFSLTPTTLVLDPAKWYHLTFSVVGDTLTGKLYDHDNLTTPILVTTARDTHYTQGLAGFSLTDKGLQGNPKLNNPIQISVDNFYAAEILIAPSLTIGRAAILSWPSAYAGYILEGAGTSNGPWLPAGVTPALQGSENVATVRITNDRQFFRLRKPAN